METIDQGLRSMLSMYLQSYVSSMQIVTGSVPSVTVPLYIRSAYGPLERMGNLFFYYWVGMSNDPDF